MKKIFICLLSLFMMFTSAFPVMAEEINDEEEVVWQTTNEKNIAFDSTVTGTYNYAYAQDILNRVNALRTSLGLTKLVMDQEATMMAMQRAAEISTLYSHIRPDGTNGNDIFFEGSASFTMWAENIAKYQASPAEVFSAWENSEGHYENMTNKNYTTIGIGCVYANGAWNWVQLFRNGKPGTICTDKSSANGSWTVHHVGPYSKVQFAKKSVAVDIDSTYKLEIKYDGKYPLDNSLFNWISTNTSIAKVSNGVVTPVNIGTTTIIASYDTITLYATVKVMYRDGWHKIDGKWYYIKDEAFVKGWVKTLDNWYYCGDDYAMVKGLQTINGKLYSFTNAGVMETGWKEIDGEWYYFNSCAKDGWQKIDNKWYYFIDYKMVNGKRVIDGKTYLLDNYMKTGFIEMSDGIHYFKNDEKDGWQKIDDKWYFFKNNVMQTGKIVDNGKTYYLKDNGVMVSSGWVKEGSEWIYLDSSSVKATGWRKVNEIWYYMDPSNNGYMVSDTTLLINGQYYTFNEKGAMLTGWVSKIDSLGKKSWYYFAESGKRVTGWIKLNGIWYYLQPDKDGLMASDCTLTIDGENHAFLPNGKWNGRV